MRRFLFAGLMAAGLSASPSLAAEVTIATALGDAEVPQSPETLVVFDPAAIDTLLALDVPIAGVPAPLYLDSLVAATGQAEVVGTLFEPDFEALAIMQPDLIIAGGRSSTQVTPLSQIAPVIDMTIWGEHLMDQAKARIGAYGTLFGIEDRAEALTGALDDKIAAARAATEGKGNALILLTNGGKISAYGANSRFGWLHETLGLPEAHPELDAETHGQSISFEFVAETDPDWLLVIDRGSAVGQGGEAAEATLDNPIMARTRAMQSGRVVYLDAGPLYIAGGGAASMMHTLDEMIAAFAAEG